MKYSTVIVSLLSVFLISCLGDRETKTNPSNILLKIPDITVEKSLLDYNNKISLWTLNDQPFSGNAVSYYQDSILKEKISILDGKKENQTKHWFPNGYLKQVSNYHTGKLHGEKKVWSSDINRVLISHLNYKLGKAHGEQKQWYDTGELHKKLNLYQGHEKGIQQAFRKNGNVYANYEVKEGRIFGLKKASLCFNLENESIKNKNR